MCLKSKIIFVAYYVWNNSKHWLGKCLRLCEGLKPGLHNFMWNWITKLSEKKTIHTLCVVVAIILSSLLCSIHSRISHPTRWFYDHGNLYVFRFYSYWRYKVAHFSWNPIYIYTLNSGVSWIRLEEHIYTIYIYIINTIIYAYLNKLPWLDTCRKRNL